MAESVQVSCITKRIHNDPHERIQGLGGMHNSKPWYQIEADIIAEFEKPETIRRWNYYTSVNGRSVWIIIASHNCLLYTSDAADE